MYFCNYYNTWIILNAEYSILSYPFFLIFTLISMSYIVIQSDFNRAAKILVTEKGGSGGILAFSKFRMCCLR